MPPSDPHRNALTVSTRLLWYRIDQVLGQGAFGITYLAEDGNLHRPVAIKEYLPGQLARRESDSTVLPLNGELAEEYNAGLRRFIDEARTLAKFEHPSIVRVHNVFEANGTAYMVMQYEEGEGLDRILKRRSTLPEQEILGILDPLLSGLEAIHARGFVHRDVKPANIFIRRSGQPVLLDFGSARQAIAGEARTLTNFVSPGYAPIEQYSAKSDKQGPWSDIYGLGATLYKAVTGQTPADAIERSESIAQETHDTFEAGSSRAAGKYSRELLAAIDHALQFRIGDRPQTVAAWRRELAPAFARLTGTNELAPTEPLTAPTARALPATPDLQGLTEVAAATVRTQRLAAAPGVKSARLRTAAYWIGAIAAAALLGGALMGLVVRMNARTTPPVTSAPVAAVAGPPVPQSAAAGSAAPPSVTGIAAEPAPADPIAQRRDRIAELLYAAGDDLDKLRLTSPAGNNAYEKYREILALEPAHPAAMSGIEAISDRYVGLAYRDIERNDLGGAARYLDKADALTPGRTSIGEARAALQAKRDAAANLAGVETRPPPPPVNSSSGSNLSRQTEKFKKRFEDFLKKQQRENPRRKSRSDQFIDQLDR